MKRLLFALLFSFTALHAQQVINRIEVVGNVPASIVTTQSTLTEGRSYTDKDLDVAVARIRRLPFVFDARYVVDGDTLVLEVTSSSPLFFAAESSGTRLNSTTNSTGLLSAGGRHYLGAGVAEARVTKLLEDGGDTRSVDLAYSHYRIGGTRLFATLGGSVPFTQDENRRLDPSWHFTVGYPLTLRQTLTASAQQTGSSGERTLINFTRPLVSYRDRTALELRWTYDTTDDPYFTRRGTIVTAGPSWTWEESLSESASIFFPGPSVIHSTYNDGRSTRLAAEALHFVPVASRGSVFAGLLASVEDRNFDTRIDGGPVETVVHDPKIIRASLGFGYNFFDANATSDRARNRLEFDVAARRLFTDIETHHESSLGVTYLFRKPFANVRLRFAYDFD